MEKHLAVDLGSSNGKILIGEITADEKIVLKEIHRFETPRTWFNEHICTDIYHVLDEIAFAIRSLGARGIGIGSMGADSWSSDYAIFNPQGELVGLPVFYRDGRTLGMPEEVEKVISYKDLYMLSTQRRMRDSTLCQLLAQKRENFELLKGGNKMLFLGDALMCFFSRRLVSEITLASYSQLFNMAEKRWENVVFDMFRLPRSLQPEIVNPCDCLGRVSEQAAAWYGVNRFEVVAPAGHDTSCAVAAVPADSGKNWAFISAGSWFLVGMELDKPMNLESCYRYDFSNTGLAFGKTMLKRNVAAMWLLQECVKAWRRTNPELTYPEIQARAQAAKPFYAMLDVDAADFYNPDNMPMAIRDYLKRTGQPGVEADDVGQITRLVDEGISFKSAYAVNCLESITGRKIDTVYAVGGASAVEFLDAMLTDAMNRELVAGPIEATAIGNCLLQAYGCGEISSEEELRRIVKNSSSIRHYVPRDAAPWLSRYDAYIDFCGLEK